MWVVLFAATAAAASEGETEGSSAWAPIFEVVEDGLQLGLPLALTVGEDGRVYGGNVSPWETYVSEIFRIDHGIYTPLDVWPVPVELALEGFVRGSDGAYYCNQIFPCDGLCGPFHELVKVTSDGTRTVLGGEFYPSALDSDGAVYGRTGTTCVGFPYVCGWGVFRLGTDAELSILHPIVEGIEGGAWTLGGDGFLYGTRPYEGLTFHASVFKMDNEGDITEIHDFSGPDGGSPGPLTLGGDGSMYGVTSTGGGAGAGT